MKPWFKVIIKDNAESTETNYDLIDVISRGDANNEEDRVNKCCDSFRARVQQLNDDKYRELQSHLDAAVNNLIANGRYRFLDPSGPKCTIMNAKNPIMYK